MQTISMAFNSDYKRLTSHNEEPIASHKIIFRRFLAVNYKTLHNH